MDDLEALANAVPQINYLLWALHYEEGVQQKRLAELLGVTEPRIWQRIQREARRRGKPEPVINKLRELRKNIIIALLEQGLSYREIADKVGCKASTVAENVREYKFDKEWAREHSVISGGMLP